jgi:ubiquinone/menaquinone biosynthesis C-methylase UbiE/glycosyltransferase involved in cell wall biosynthesis
MPLAVANRAGLTDPGKDTVRSYYDSLASVRDEWYERNRYYHTHIETIVRSLIPPGASVLELGCGTGNLLAAVQPGSGLGLDISPAMVEAARRKYPELEFEVADAEDLQLGGAQFDFVIASDLVGELGDITAMLEGIRLGCHSDSRLVVTFHNPALEGVLRAAQRLRLAMKPARQNWVGQSVMENLLELADYRLESLDHSMLVPKHVPFVARWINTNVSGRRPLRYVDLVNVMVAKPIVPRPKAKELSATVLIPCRNEVGNIEAAIDRVPDLGVHTEILFVDGSSTDGTKEKIEEMIRRYEGEKDIRLLLQVPEADYGRPAVRPDSPTRMLRLGKGDAVRKGFDVAKGDVLMILDADLTVPPEDLPRFFHPIATGQADFVNGSRLVYPMEERAMKFLNYLGNWFFSVLFTWLLERPIRDTLCGTKALSKASYQKIKGGRAYFGEFDPFGDFDLLFGAARQNLHIIEVPVRYRRRTAGVSKVRVSQHGWLLLGMSFIGFRRLKLAKWLRRRGA